MHDAQITKPATDALTDLVNTCRGRAYLARRAGKAMTAKAFDDIAKTLDGARTRLVEDGPDYLDAAWAFVDGARKVIAGMHEAAPVLALIEKAARR